MDVGYSKDSLSRTFLYSIFIYLLSKWLYFWLAYSYWATY